VSTTARRAAAWAIGSGLLAVAAGLVLRSYQLPAPLRVLISLAPVVPMTVYCALSLRLIRELDELQARIQLEGAVYGLLGTALLTMSAGLLVKGNVLPAFDLSQAWPWLWMSAFLLWAAGAAVARRRYE
jgi:hypothetical protein